MYLTQVYLVINNAAVFVNMKKKTKIILISIIVLVIGYSIYWLIFRTCCGPKPVLVQTNNITKDQRLADPNLLYFSSWWAGLCANEKHEQGGCYRELYLYSDGEYIKMSGFVKYNEEDGKEEDSNVQNQLSSLAIEKIKTMIRDSGIMASDCPTGQIMDAGWDYQINLDGVKKSFHNPPEICRDTFNVIDDTLDMPIE